MKKDDNRVDLIRGSHTDFLEREVDKSERTWARWCANIVRVLDGKWREPK